MFFSPISISFTLTDELSYLKEISYDKFSIVENDHKREVSILWQGRVMDEGCIYSTA